MFTHTPVLTHEHVHSFTKIHPHKHRHVHTFTNRHAQFLHTCRPTYINNHHVYSQLHSYRRRISNTDTFPHTHYHVQKQGGTCSHIHWLNLCILINSYIITYTPCAHTHPLTYSGTFTHSQTERGVHTQSYNHSTPWTHSLTQIHLHTYIKRTIHSHVNKLTKINVIVTH